MENNLFSKFEINDTYVADTFGFNGLNGLGTVNPPSTIDEVEKRLQEAQRNKDVKDIGRVANTKKEKAAYKIISLANLEELEQNPILAFNLTKKETVWPEIDWKAEKNNGVDSGAAYLKIKIRGSVPSKPADNAEKRKSYITFLGKLQADLAGCFTITDIINVIEGYGKWSINEVIGYLIKPEFLSFNEEQKQAFLALFKQRFTNLSYASYIFKKLIKEVFNTTFSNMLFKQSEAAATIWNDARKYNGITTEESAALIERYKKNYAEQTALYQKRIDEIKAWTTDQLKAKLKEQNSGTRSYYADRLEELRKSYINSNQKYIDAYQKVDLNERFKAYPMDWSWADPKARTTETVKSIERINTKTPLDYIKRTGGVKVDAYNPKMLVDLLGYSAVNYGNYVNDAWSKEHTRYYIGAMYDMGEMLNIDIKALTQLGKLKIAFGAKGMPGHAAAYWPQTKDINLTKKNGDGSVAHEYGHYFDNVMVDLSEQKSTPQFATEGKINSNDKLKELFKEFTNFIEKGNPEITPRLPIYFPALPSETTITVTDRLTGKHEPIKILDTIEETLAQYEQYAKLNVDLRNIQKKVFGFIIHAFGLPGYEVPMKFNGSYVLFTTRWKYFNYFGESIERGSYWTSIVEVWARTFETVILKKLLSQNRLSNYLVDGIPMSRKVFAGNNAPYPMGAELDYLEQLIDRIVAQVKLSFNIGDFAPPTQERQDEYIEFAPNQKGKDKVLKVNKTPIVENTLVQETEPTKETEAITNTKKYFYKMKVRPFGIGTHPKDGFVSYTEKNKATDGIYGILEYDRPLTNDEILNYELVDANPNSSEPTNDTSDWLEIVKNSNGTQYYDKYATDQIGEKLKIAFVYNKPYATDTSKTSSYRVLVESFKPKYKAFVTDLQNKYDTQIPIKPTSNEMQAKAIKAKAIAKAKIAIVKAKRLRMQGN